MRCSILIALAVASLASASSIGKRQGYPTCADPCLAGPTAVTSATCDSQNVECLCKDNTFITAAAECLEQHCSGADLTNAESVSNQVCLSAGVTITASPPPLTPLSNTNSASNTASQSKSSTTAQSTTASPSISPSTTPKSGAAFANIASSNAAFGIAAVAALAFAL